MSARGADTQVRPYAKQSVLILQKLRSAAWNGALSDFRHVLQRGGGRYFWVDVAASRDDHSERPDSVILT